MYKAGKTDNLSASTSTRTTEEVYNEGRPPFPSHTCALEEDEDEEDDGRWMVIRERGLSRSGINVRCCSRVVPPPLQVVMRFTEVIQYTSCLQVNLS
jgi:hypothetical protein